MVTEPSSDKTPAPAVTRAIRVLRLLAEADGKALGLSEIARALNIAKSSTSNLCAALEECDMIQRSDSGYRLGRQTVELGGAYLATFDQVREFYRFCSDSPVLGLELVQLAVLAGTDVLYLARHEGRAPLRMSASIGDRYPASITAVGNALLAELPDDEIRRRFADPSTRPALTEDSVTSLDGLLEKLHATRERGYSLDLGEVFPSVTGLAVIVPPRRSGESPFALGVSMVKMMATTEMRARIIEELRRAVALLSNPMIF